MLKKGGVRCGDIIWTEFNPSVGHEFQDKRPALVIQSNQQLSKSNLVTVMPITSNINNRTFDDILIQPDKVNKLNRTSVVKVYAIVSCDYQRLIGKVGMVSREIMEQTKKYLKKHFGV
ncbi:MAG TPA: type II toxin-antitoxin system PemK/MazF family toxin [Patescibacteria group bacterium]|nr:type II toxin-antitoxin system PemK/MazF family toxin [Patescibacteria group bacterium]